LRNYHLFKPRLASIFLLLAAFSIPFAFANGVIFVWLALFAFTLTKADFRDFQFFSKQNIPQISILFLYLLGVFSLLYVENTSEAVKQLTGQRLFMLLLSLAAIVRLCSFVFSDILKTYVLGCFVFLLYLLAFVAWQFFVGMPVELLVFPHYISGLINDEILPRSYISLNLTLCIIAVIYLHQNKQIERKFYPFYIVLLALIACVLLFLNSRAAFISVVVLLLFYTVYFARKSSKMLLVFSLVLSFCFALFFIIPNRLTDSLVTVESRGVAQLNEPRLIVWEDALTVVQNQSLWGNGTNAARDLLRQQFEKKNFQEGINEGFNAHSQYLEYLIEYGPAGLLLLLAVLVYIPKVCRKEQRLFYIPFAMVFAVNFFFESMLVRHAGVVTFVFFVMLLKVKEDITMKNKKWINARKHPASYYLLSILLVLSILLLLIVGYFYYNTKQKNVYFHINPKIENKGVVQLNKDSRIEYWEGNAYAYSPFLYAKLTAEQRLTINSEVFVSEDFNGTWAMISIETPNHLNDMQIHYDMNRKGTWQPLEVMQEKFNGEVKALFHISQYNASNLSNLQGKVLFRNTTYSISTP
jgi:O-antigen ligase